LESPTFEREAALWSGGHSLVAGLDEVGRGPLAGPVVAAAVVFPPDTEPIEGLRDSKTLSALQRGKLVTIIHERAQAWSLGAASVREIDRANILWATARAMRRAIHGLDLTPDRLLVDGTALPELGMAHESVIKGDSISQSIAAASILAKEARDHLMGLLHVRYPAFGWASNKGYGTADHMAAIKSEGLSPHHRQSFTPVGQFDLFSD
jgi:ribonuclease HII